MKPHLCSSHFRRLRTLSLLMIPLAAFSAIAAEGTAYYVSANGNDAQDGLSADTPFATLAKAVETANADETTKEIVVLTGMTVPAPLEIMGAYVLKGNTADPADTVITADGAVGPIIKVSAPGGTVAHLTLSGGTGSDSIPANLSLTAGTIATNCVSRDGKNSWIKMASVKNENGLVTHCIIEKNNISSEFGTGIYQTGAEAVLEHSVIRDNHNMHWNSKGAGVYLDGGTMRYCEITGNDSSSAVMAAAAGSGIYISGQASVDHCLIAGNVGGCRGQSMNANSGAAVHVAGSGVRMSNCTIVSNEGIDGCTGGICNAGQNNYFSDLIVWGNEAVAAPSAGASADVFPGNGTWENILSIVPVGTDPVAGEPAFVDSANGDYSLTAGSPAIGAGMGGCDLGYKPYDASVFAVGLKSFGEKPLVAGPRTFEAVSRAAESAVSYRWRLDDLGAGTEGTWTDYAPSATYDATLVPGHFKLLVEAQDASGAVASSSYEFRIAAEKVYLVSAGTEGNNPVAPYATLETAANDIQEAIRYCGPGSELVVSDGVYEIDGEIVVDEQVSVKSVNGPEKTSIIRIGDPGQGGGFRLLKLAGEGSVVSGFTLSNAFLNDNAHVGAAAFLAPGALLENCVIEKFGKGGDNAVYCLDASVRGCVFRNADGYGSTNPNGGALYLTGPNACVSDSVFSNLYPSITWQASGSAIHAAGGSRIERCIIRDCKNQRNGIGNCGLGSVYLEKASIYDSLLDDNQFRQGSGIYVKAGPAEIVNCTIVNNRAQDKGAGLFINGNFALTVKNTLFYGNHADSPGSAADHSWTGLGGSNIKASNLAAPTEAEAIGEGSIPLPQGPGFNDADKGDYTLSMSSPCRDKGDNGTRLETETDLAGEPRIVKGTIDIGAYEFQLSDKLACNFIVSGYQDVGKPVSLVAVVEGANLEGLQIRWRYKNVDTGETTWTPETALLEESLDLPAGRYTFALEAWTTSQPQRSLFEDPTIYNVVAKDIYLVSPENASETPVYPYDSLETAATNLAMAMTAAGGGSTVTVARGDYGVESTILLDRAIRLVSSEGPEVTSIYRAYPFKDEGHVFCSLSLADPGAYVSGFTVSNHIAMSGVDGTAIRNSYGTIANCVITGNDNDGSGMERGGAIMNFNGLVSNCIFEGNVGGCAGAAFKQAGEKARTEHCIIRNNKYGSYHGRGNIAIEGGVVSECVITNNSVSNPMANGQFSGGVYISGGTLYNCLVAENHGAGGAGGVLVSAGSIVNCTIVSNIVSGITDNNSAQAGGIAAYKDYSRAYITNTIVADNWNEKADGTLQHAHNAALFNKEPLVLSHTLLDNWEAIDPDAEGCLAVDPQFKDADHSNWRLGVGSPCRDAGIMLDFQQNGLDLDGRPRVVHKDLVDLGCYEAPFIGYGTMMIVR